MSLTVFSERLKSLMAQEKVSKRSLSEKSDIQRKSIINYVNGRFYPRYDSLTKLVDFFEVSADYLLGREDECFFSFGSEHGINDIPAVFVQRMSGLLIERNISKYRFAGLLGVGQSAVSKWIHNVSMPETALLMQIADALDCTVDYLLGRSRLSDG